MSGRLQSIRFVNGRIYRDASDRITLRGGSVADLLALEQDPFDLSVDQGSIRTLMTVVRETIRHDVLGSHHFKAAEVFN